MDKQGFMMTCEKCGRPNVYGSIRHTKECAMKTLYKHIHFRKITDLPKTSVWSCLSNRTKDELGMVKWYPSWRQYCFFPHPETVYSTGCLEDIKDFIRQLKQSR